MRFNYLEPASVEEAVSLLSKHDGKARIIAGGTDLIVKLKDRAIKPEYVVDIGYIPGLEYIDYDKKKGLRIGALTTIRAIEKSDKLSQAYPVICQSAGLLGSMAIRNVATIGGNLCNATPSADMAPALLGLSAVAKITGPGGQREVLLEEFFTCPGGTCLKKGEILLEIQVPPPSPNTRGVYLKHSRTAVDLATVGVAVIMTSENGTCKDIRIALGAVSPTPMRAKQAEDLLRGKKVTENLIEKVAQEAADESKPISDVRASVGYRREIVRVLTRRAIKQLIAK